MTHILRSRIYRFTGLTLLCGLFAVGVGLNRQLMSFEKVRAAKTTEDAEVSASFRWHPELYKILSFGHLPASVDWLLIRFLTDTNLTKAKGDTETELSRILNLATDLDPAFFSLYTTGANFLAIVRGDRQGALKLLKKGELFLKEQYPKTSKSFREQHWPSPWRIEMAMGYLYLLEFQNVEEASRAYLRLLEYPDVPPMLKSIATSIQTTEGRFRIALNSLSIIKKWYPEDPVMLAELENKERDLLFLQKLYVWNREFRKFGNKKESAEVRFENFKREKNIPDSDAVRGRILLNPDARIVSEVAVSPVFGFSVEE